MLYFRSQSKMLFLKALPILSVLWILNQVWVSSGYAFESFESVKNKTVLSDGILLDRNREVIHEIRIHNKYRQLKWAPLDTVSPILKDALIRSEDQRFWRHSGVDWQAMAWVTMQNLVSKHPRGASTITMQLTSLLNQQLSPKRNKRSLSQKFKQMIVARDLEKHWSKEQILEAYLNLVPFRGELKGITAASQALFSKDPHGLDFNESMILAALIRSPNARTEDVTRRACHLGKQIQASYSCDQIQTWINQGLLKENGIKPKVLLAPHLARRVLKSSVTQVTLDGALQKHVLDTLKRQILLVRDRNVHDAVALVVDNESGEVLAYVGGVGELSTAHFVDGVRAQRQAGSTLKPFLYAIGIEKRLITAASTLEDIQLDIPTELGTYRPRNYDNEYHGKDVTVRMALASSLNVPAVRAINLVGVDEFVRKLSDLRFSDLRRSEFYGPSIALGSVDVTLWDLVNAYRTLARGGLWGPLQVEKNQPVSRSHRVFSQQTSFLISDILSDRESRSLTFGLENSLSLRFWAAVKTGTSKDMRDNWCIGYSDKYTVGVWVGNYTGEPMWNVTGVTGAAPAWAEIMKWLHRKELSRKPRVPSGIVQMNSVNRPEWFMVGTEPIQNLEKIPQKNQKIIYPTDGMMIARDPDIPSEVQRILFESSSSEDDLKWVLNGKELESKGGKVAWFPDLPGRYHLLLRSSQGQTIDSVHFYVR